MTLYKRSSGLIRDDVFTNAIPQGYIVSPLNRFGFTGSALRLDRDTNQDVRVLTDVSGACVVEVTADYTPTETGDSGGLLLFANATQTSEFLEVADDTVVPTVSRWRAKTANGANWDFYADSGNGFAFLDSVLEFTANKAGVVLKRGNGSGFVPLLLQRITITKDDTIQVTNMTNGMTAELMDQTDTVVSSAVAVNNTVSLILSSLLVTGKIRIKNGSTVVEEVSGTFAGGDRYDVGSTLKIVKDNVMKEEFSVTDLSDFGMMANGVLEKKIYLYNPGGSSATSIDVSVLQYNATFGFQWVDVAKDVSGSPGAYGDRISYTSLAANVLVPFWVRVTQGSGYDGFDPLRFALELQHS